MFLTQVKRHSGARILTALLGVAALAGCLQVGPDYAPPTIALEQKFSKSTSGKKTVSPQTEWWREFNDKKLEDVVARGAARNLDLKIALARIKEAEAIARTSGLNAQLSGTASNTQTRQRTGSLPIQTSDAQSVSATYVFDIFGGFARERQRALAVYKAQQFEVGTARLAFLSEVISSYIELRFRQRSLQISRTIVENDESILKLVKDRYRAGLSTEIEEQQAIARLARSRVDLPVQQARFEVEIFRLATLLDQPASAIFPEFSTPRDQPEPKSAAISGVPIELLRNRPDVRTAERIIEAETASIGVATARLYPTLSITGDRTNADFNAWNTAASLTAPILERGRLMNLRDAQVAKALQAEVQWRKTVMEAVEDVQIAMREAKAWRDQIATLRTATAATLKFRRLSNEQYKSGVITLSELLDANTQYAETLLQEAEALRGYASSWTRVQIAAGRGWQGPLLTKEETKEPDLTADPLGLKPIASVENAKQPG